MFADTFGHGTLRKYVIYFGTMFNNIWLQRFDKDGSLVQTMKVPLNYGPREKFLARLDGNPNLDRPIAISLPRMSFEMTGIYYDAQRKLNTLNRISVPNPNYPDNKWYQYQPVPYNITFELSIMVKNAEDGTFIVEQILPYFTPEWTATLKLNPDMNAKYDVPVMLDNITSEDTYEGNFETRRAIIWTLSFTMKGWLFGPTKGKNDNGQAGRIIKDIDANLWVPQKGVMAEDGTPDNSQLITNINIKPGLTANGQPTSNAALSVDPSEISADDNYGFIIDIQSNE